MIAAIKRFTIDQLEPRFYGALWFAAVATIAAMAALTILNRGLYKEEITLLAAFLALEIATIGWIWSGRMSILMARKTNALMMLARISSPEINALKDKVYPYIEAYDAFKRDVSCSRPTMPENEVQMLLGVYEQLSVAVSSRI